MTTVQPKTGRSKKEERLEDPLLSAQEVAKWMGVSVRTIKRREKDGQLSPIRFNDRLVRYRLSDVLKIQQQATV
jgi:predicted DNA-binding transcriptional regulator AlpA